MNVPVFIASLPDHPSVGENLEFILVGFVFVILVLLILAGVTQLVGALFKQPEAPKKATAPVEVPTQVTPVTTANVYESDGESLDPQLTVVLVAAAVHAVIGDKPHRILSIRPTQQGWAEEGRRQIFSSHSVR